VSVRSLAKPAAERLILLSGVPALWRLRRRADVLILAYHNIVPDDTESCGDASLHLKRSRFAAQLDLLSRTHAVVPLPDALCSDRTPGGRPLAAITFDDAYQGALTLGAAELARRGLPWTVFVAPRFVGGAAFWWDEIDLPADPAARARFRERALTECAGRDEAVRELAAQGGFGRRQLPVHARCASESEIGAAVSSGAVTLGSHSWSHPNLAALTATEVTEEVTRPLAWLRSRFDAVTPLLAYPYGLHSESAAEVVARAGYSGALLIDGGWLRRDRVDPMRVPRVDVPAALSNAGFALRASGLFAA
jgi:peptidoglycan/xylan/chitin deacetylase (PgdA/CDA1 family)